MAKNVLQKHWTGSAWEELHPITKPTNVIDEDGINVADRLANKANKGDSYINVLSPPPPLIAAKGDGETYDTVPFQAAINTGRKVYVPWTANGYVLSKLYLGDDTEIEGENLVTLYCDDDVLFNIASVRCKVYGFRIDMNGAPPGSTAILLNHAVKVCWFIRLERLQFFNCYGAITDDAVSGNYVTDLQAVDCYAIWTKGVQYRINHSRGFITFRECVVDHTYNTTAVTWMGFVFEDFIGLELEKCDVMGPVSALVTPTYQPSAIGIYINGSPAAQASVWLTRVLVDNTMGDGIYIENVLNLIVNGAESYQNLGSPITLKNITVAQITNLFTLGGVGLTGAPSGVNGITFNGCQKMTINNLKSSYNKGIGVSTFNTTDCIFNGVEISNNESFGWYESGTSNRNIVTGAIMVDNDLANLVQQGTASAFTHWLNDGTWRAHDVGAVTV